MPSMTRRILAFALRWTCAAACVAGVAAAYAADPYPARSVKILMPNSPGGPSDAMIRGVADLLSADLGQSFVVENRPGGDGVIAGSACSSAPPDGYTLCFADAFNTMLLPLTKAHLPYDPAQWVPVTLFGFLPTGMWCNGTCPGRDARGVLEAARKQPGTVTIGSWGRAASPYLHAEYLRKKQGIDLNVIAYRSAVASFQGTVAGEINLSLYGLRAGVPMISTSKVHLLAINTETRLPEFPDTPTFSEIGLQQGTMLWFGLFAPPGTPTAIIDKLNERISKLAFQDAAAKERLMTKNGILPEAPAGAPRATIAPFLKEQREIYKRWVSTAGVQPE